MKKVLSCILAGVMTIAVACSMVACDSNNGKFASIHDYVQSDEVQAELETLTSSADGSGMSIEVAGEENKLIYRYTFDENIATDGMAESLETALNAQASVFESIASQLKLAVNVENPVVVVEYLAHDGTVIYSEEFTAK